MGHWETLLCVGEPVRIMLSVAGTLSLPVSPCGQNFAITHKNFNYIFILV